MNGPPTLTPGRAGGPSPVARGVVTLVLRLTLGFALVDAGALGYLQARKAAAVAVAGIYSPYEPPTTSFLPATPPNSLAAPGLEAYNRYAPYGQIAIGVALLLGFLTTFSASAAALWPLFLRALKVFFLLAAGIPDDPRELAYYAFDDLLRGGTLLYLLLSVAVIWLASAGDDRFSVDALIRRRGAVGEPPLPTVAAGSGAHVTAGRIPDVPAVGAVNPVGKEFDPGLYLDETIAGNEPR